MFYGIGHGVEIVFFYQNEEREIKIIKVETILEQLKIINISN